MMTHVRLDSRRRVSLRGIGQPEHTVYLVSVLQNGTIVLIPVPQEEPNDLSTR